MVGLVDDEQDGEMPLLDEALDFLLDEPEGHGSRPLGLKAELEGQLAAKVGGVDQSVMQIEGADLVGVQFVAQPSEGRGLATAGLAGEDAEGAGVDQVAQTRVQLFEPRRAMASSW